MTLDDSTSNIASSTSTPRRRSKAFRPMQLFALIACASCANATVADDGSEEGNGLGGSSTLASDGDGDGDSTGSGSGGVLISASGGTTGDGDGDGTGGGLIGSSGGSDGDGGEGSGGATGGASSGGASSGGTSSGGAASGGAASGGAASGGATTGGSCESPDLPSYTNATACDQTVVYAGSLYKCVTMYNQAGDCNKTAGVWRCNEYAPDNPTWGDDAWELVQACP